MNLEKYVFSQLLEFVDRYEFEKCIKRYAATIKCGILTVESVSLTVFRAVTSLNSLRDICLCLKAHRRKFYHLGIRQVVNQSRCQRTIGFI